MSEPLTPAPRGYRSWHEFYHTMVYTANRSGVQLADENELTWEQTDYVAGFLMTVEELPPGLTVGRVKILAFDEIMRTMPTDRHRLFDEVHGIVPPNEGSPIRWLDNLIREQNLSK